MKKVYVHILKSFSGPVALAFCIVVFILLMQMLWRYIDDIVGKGLEASVIAEFMFWATLNVIPLALPLSMLFASIMTMGNLGGSNELLAMKSAGLSLVKILRPMFFVAALVTMFAFYVADNVMPYAMMKIYSVFWDIRNKRPDAQIVPGVFCAINDNVIKVATKDPKTNKMTGILLYQHPEGKGNIALIVADSGYIKTENDNMIVTLYNGVSYEDATSANFAQYNNNFAFQKRIFDRHTLIVDLSANKMQRTDAELFKGRTTTMRSTELAHIVDSVSAIQIAKVNYFWTEYCQSQSFDNRMEIDTVTSIANRDEVKNRLLNVINTDSIFNQFPRERKVEALRYALEKSTSTLSTMGLITSDITSNEQSIRSAQVEWHYKFTLSIACFIFFLIGAPFGAIIRKGGLGMPTVASLLIFIAYFILTTITKKMAMQGVLPVVFAMWFADALFLPLGIFLMRKATTDSALFDSDKYVQFFRHLFRIDDKKGYHKPAVFNSTGVNLEMLLQLLEKFDSDTDILLSKAKLKKLETAEIEAYYDEYDKLLSKLWGIQNEGLNEKLKEYPEIELRIFKTGISYMRNAAIRLLSGKLEKIKATNDHVEYIVKKIKW
ncbi:MAG: LptF/LptG family permease [Prevotellaceae bacterium]|nr:LptF/LptG family permease [Prevotellaceae bacterium]